MDDDGLAAGVRDRGNEVAQESVVVAPVDANPALDRHRDCHGAPHRPDAIRDQAGLGHQADAEPARLHPVARASDIQVDLVIAAPGADTRAFGERRRIGPAELERDRMLVRIETQQALAVAVQDRPGRNHLSVEQRPAGDPAQEIAVEPVGAVHHRRHAEPPVGAMARRRRVAPL